MTKPPTVTGDVLRIIGGRLDGKEYPLMPGARILIGHALASDVVLRGAGTRELCVELRVAADAAVVHVVSGTIELLGRPLAAGDEAMLPAYLPFRFGEFLVAHGGAGSARWAEAESVGGGRCGAPVTPLPVPRLGDRLVAQGRAQAARVVERFGGRRLALAAVSAVLLTAAVQPVGALISDREHSPESLAQTLEQGGFHSLKVSADPVGGLIVHGAVARDGDLARLRTLVATRDVPVVLDVTSSAALATAAADVLQAQGVQAKAAPAGAGGIVVTAAYMPTDTQERLRKLLSNDVPGLQRVSFRTDDALGDNPLQSYFARSGAGLVTVVEDPGYIATADGSRWFPGATLPTGHKLVAITDGRIRFEKDGRFEDVRL
ncbi:hypothetical protein [Sphingomonas sp. NFR15]|uniref:hypothetical protein n=1 Tax=Sphingomonas sp. NFR15 TaxID=1566282 RepID=UPI000885CA01|nr:hypothetical protein [Sphingomonas sp. NFR15]SDA36245.1 hypothetical protein SAMN03159340_03585 [Sphingomonas sp. NFR15]